MFIAHKRTRMPLKAFYPLLRVLSLKPFENNFVSFFCILDSKLVIYTFSIYDKMFASIKFDTVL